MLVVFSRWWDFFVFESGKVMSFDIFDVQSNLTKYDHIESVLVVDGCDDFTPEVSVMIPTFRRPRLLEQALMSALSQEGGIAYEVVVIDNDSGEGFSSEIERVVTSFLPARIRLYRNEKNIGMFGNWNRCITLARSPWVSILNDDDILLPDFIAKMYPHRALDKILICDVERFGGGGGLEVGLIFRWLIFLKRLFSRMVGVSVCDLKFWDVVSSNPVPGTLGAFIPKDLAERLGGFDDNAYPQADYLFTLKCWHHFGLIRLKKCLAKYRWEDNESMRVEVLYGFLSNDLAMRLKYIEAMNGSDFGKRVLASLARLQARSVAHVSYFAINNNFSPQWALNKLGLAHTRPIMASAVCFLRKYIWWLAVICTSVKPK